VTLLNRAYVDDNDYLKWCPAPNCEYAVECHVPTSQLDHIAPTVRCGCGHGFCFGCTLVDHQPCTCPLVKKWLKKCKDDSETANWISANTKECSRCNSTIEKNGGCNHMTCRKCAYEFCWICMGPWSEHGSQWYNCNRYEENSSTDARDHQAKSRASLERYLHVLYLFWVLALIHSTIIVMRITNNPPNLIENCLPEQRRKWDNYKSHQTCRGSKSSSSKTQSTHSLPVVRLSNGVMLSRTNPSIILPI
jgi:IBR domain, a half RING-finger domain